MRVAVIGAYGLIGSYVSARLAADGHEVVGFGRDIAAARRRLPALDWRPADLAADSVEDWVGRLTDVEAVINCAGALQDGVRDNLKAVHVDGVERLLRACERADVRRLVHISAAGLGPEGGTAFNVTKLQSETAIAASALDWIILRPGLVFAPAAYGGTALLRGLAGFPGVSPVVYGDSRVQVVGAEDLAIAVARCLAPGAPSRLRLDLVHLEALTLADLIRRLRGWLGLPPAPTLHLPLAAARATAAASSGAASGASRQYRLGHSTLYPMVAKRRAISFEPRSKPGM